MVRIILSGCNGRMGRVISACVHEREDCSIVGGIDLDTSMPFGYPVFGTPADCQVPADVLIDFSTPAVLPALLEMVLRAGLPAVIATTGLGESQVRLIGDAAKHIPIFFSANMSLGVNLLTELAKKAARVLGGEFDIEIVEKHHNQKVDAPSGTALMLADAIGHSLDTLPQYVYDRHSVRRKRAKNEIGLHAVRGGTIVGEHDIIFAGHDEIITLSHSAMSKEIFATGSLSAALFLTKQGPGLYDMSHLLNA